MHLYAKHKRQELCTRVKDKHTSKKFPALKKGLQSTDISTIQVNDYQRNAAYTNINFLKQKQVCLYKWARTRTESSKNGAMGDPRAKVSPSRGTGCPILTATGRSSNSTDPALEAFITSRPLYRGDEGGTCTRSTVLAHEPEAQDLTALASTSVNISWPTSILYVGDVSTGQRTRYSASMFDRRSALDKKETAAFLAPIQSRTMEKITYLQSNAARLSLARRAEHTCAAAPCSGTASLALRQVLHRGLASCRHMPLQPAAHSSEATESWPFGCPMQHAHARCLHSVSPRSSLRTREVHMLHR